jgi:hypothetical protein
LCCTANQGSGEASRAHARNAPQTATVTAKAFLFLSIFDVCTPSHHRFPLIVFQMLWQSAEGAASPVESPFFSHVASILVDVANDPARGHVGATLWFERARPAHRHGCDVAHCLNTVARRRNLRVQLAVP